MSWITDPGVVLGAAVWTGVLGYCTVVTYNHDKNDISDVTLEMDTNHPPPWRLV